jgi:4-diphosphocytidyl-2-C-methyl-D-erythritol kinase
VTTASAPAKINLALVVGPLGDDGKHEVATVLQRLDLADSLELELAPKLRVSGFTDDTLVDRALRELAAAAHVEPSWHVRIDKRIPVAAGLAGGSSDAAAALRLANDALAEPLPPDRLHRLAAGLGADVPFFLSPGSRLGTGDGSELTPLELPLGYYAVLLLPAGAVKESTAAVYASFDRRKGAGGFEDRRRGLLEALRGVRNPADLAALPRNDLVSSPVADELERRGAFRADVSGAGPALYGLFEHEPEARAAAQELSGLGATWVCRPTRGSVEPR